MQNQNPDYSPVIEEIKKAYKSYIITKDALIEAGAHTYYNHTHQVKA